jgi:hypothetical protein
VVVVNGTKKTGSNLFYMYGLSSSVSIGPTNVVSRPDDTEARSLFGTKAFAGGRTSFSICQFLLDDLAPS